MLAPIALCLLAVAGRSLAAEYTTPVPILKQIDRHNDDGSYSYGYEAADGSFKIETKYNTGEVYGKYGYVDDTGKVREVEYGANKHGFQPAGSDINVAPPTLDSAGNNNPDGVDDGQYREDPSVYHKDPRYNNNQIKTSSKSSSNQNYYQASWGAQPSRSNFEWTFDNQQWNQPSQPRTVYNPPQPIYNPPQPVYNPPQPVYNQPQPVYNPPQNWNSYWNQGIYTPQNNQNNQNYQSYYTPQRRYYEPQYSAAPEPYYFNPSQFVTHPSVKNIDYLTGSYSVSYGRR